jgi:hypothetical protein
MKIQTIKQDNTKYHNINGNLIECKGGDCLICNSSLDEKFKIWEQSIPFKIPPKGKKYKNPQKQANKGKTIKEICYTCQEIPCYLCKRTSCKEWMKEKSRKGQEQGCIGWENGRCNIFVCKRGLIESNWKDI